MPIDHLTRYSWDVCGVNVRFLVVLTGTAHGNSRARNRPCHFYMLPYWLSSRKEIKTENPGLCFQWSTARNVDIQTLSLQKKHKVSKALNQPAGKNSASNHSAAIHPAFSAITITATYIVGYMISEWIKKRCITVTKQRPASKAAAFCVFQFIANSCFER